MRCSVLVRKRACRVLSSVCRSPASQLPSRGVGASRLATDQPVSLPSCWLSLEGGLLYAFVGPAAAVVLVLTPSPLARAGALGWTHCPFRVTVVTEGWMAFLAPPDLPSGYRGAETGLEWGPSLSVSAARVGTRRWLCTCQEIHVGSRGERPAEGGEWTDG